LNAIPRRERGTVQVELAAIWEHPTKQEALVQLAASTRQIPAALSRGRAQFGRGGRADLDVLRVPSRTASAHSNHQCH
jgi:hypothetical protein